MFKLSQYRLQISQYRLQTTNSHNENLPLKQLLAQTQKKQLEKAIMDGRVASQLPPCLLESAGGLRDGWTGVLVSSSGLW